MPRIFDISVPIAAGGLVWPGAPEILFDVHKEMARGDSSNQARISMGTHTGTHVDAPRHFLDAGTTVDRLPLEAFVGPAQVIGFPHNVLSVTADHLRQYDLDGAERVLIRTRNSTFITDARFHEDFTYLAPDGAEYLAALGVKLVGVDYYSVEEFRAGHHRTHQTLLERGIVIVEGLDLSVIAPGSYAFFCLPLRLVGLDGAPARAMLMLP